MKQFNLEEYKKNPNRKVITRDGKSVKIVVSIFLMEEGTGVQVQIHVWIYSSRKRKRVG